jgi:hypothetical protein
VSIVPLLENPSAEWDTPAITTHGYKNHAVRDARWRYIRYENGDEELYDTQGDPLEYANLASDSKFASAKAWMAKHLPTEDAEPLPKRREGRKRKAKR